MAIYPGAEYRPLGKQTEAPMRAHNILCFHTMVGGLSGTDSYFKDDGYYGVESHFGVGGSTDGAADGKVNQWQDTAFGADANFDGKPEVISVETSDGGNPDRPWSAKQLDALVELGVWVCKKHDIPPVLIPDTQPGRRGIGYHRMGCDHGSSYVPKGWPYDKWREPGGVKWSTVLGKTCPGNVRIKQLVDIVIPRIRAGVEGEEDPLMAIEGTEAQVLGKIARAVRDINADPDDSGSNSLGAFIRSSFGAAKDSKYAAIRIEKAVALLLDDEEKLAALVKQQADATAEAVARKVMEMGGDPGDYETTKRALRDVLLEGAGGA